MKCDIKAARCIGNAFDLLLTRLASEHTKRVADKIPVFNLTSRIGDKKFCPNHKDTCDVDQKCCPLDGGVYGCCPLGADAVCCEDNRHCCPHLTTCNLQEGTCVPDPANRY